MRPIPDWPAPDWNDLKLFLEVARREKLADAAPRLGLDPTTLSRRLKRLEAEIGVPLLERTPNRIALTPEGVRLAACAEEMEHASAQAVSALTAAASGEEGLVRVSTAEGFGAYVVAPALAELHAAHPRIAVDLVAGSGFLSVSKREADIAILLARPRAGRLIVSKLTEYQLRLYAAKSYLARTPPITRTADLRNHALIGYVDDLLYSPKLRYLAEVLPNLSPALRSSSIVAQLRAARGGAGLCILPAFMAEGDPELAQVLPERILVRRTFWLAVHEDVSRTPRVRGVVEFLKALADRERSRLTPVAA